MGTTVVRALEFAWDGKQVCPARGFTQLYIHPEHGIHTVDGLLNGFHDPLASHLTVLYALAGAGLVRSVYQPAVEPSYLWHEFGDSHLRPTGQGVDERQTKRPQRCSGTLPHVATSLRPFGLMD